MQRDRFSAPVRKVVASTVVTGPLLILLAWRALLFFQTPLSSATLGPPGEARLEPSQKSKNFGLYLARPPRPELGSWKSTVSLGYTTTAKAHYSGRPSCGRKSKFFRFWGRAPRGLFTASSDRLGRDILTFWSESEFERSQKKIPRAFP